MDFLGENDEDYDQLSDDLFSGVDTPIEDLTIEDADFKEKIIFQKEIPFNKLLPYSYQLDEEADALLAKIKANLGRCVMLRDIRPGCVYWANMLHKYLTLYSLRFTKEDHIIFIKLMYELITIPNLESTLIGVFGHRLYSLIRKNELISPSELELPWRPLYNLCLRITAQKPSQISLHHFPSYLKSVIDVIIYSVKIYFPVSATQEILDELRPQICPLHIFSMQNTMKSLELFLPVQLTPEYHSIGHELWFHEFMKLWEVCHCTAQTWGNSIMHLITQLAYYNIGYIDWEPYIPLMFTRFVQTLNLPVCYKKMRCNNNCRISASYMAQWIASVLGKNSSQNYLDKFLKTIETYFHPANHGSWLKKLGELYVNISYFVVSRIYRERYQVHKKPSWKTPIPESHKLTDSDIDAFVNSMIPIAMIGVFNKRFSQNVYDALHYLAIMRPNIVIPNILEKVYPTIGSDIEPHKLITAMTCMISISRPLVQGLHGPYKEYGYADGPLHVLPLLFASLSGIDPNDPNKCFVTFNLIATYVTMIPIVDCSKTTAELSDSERILCETSCRFEDFVLQFMDKVFIWIDTNSLESVRLENQTNDNCRSNSESAAENSLARVFSSLLRQASYPIFLSALNKLRAFIMEHVLETQVAGPLVAVLCKVFSNVNSQETLKALFPFLSEKVLSAIGDGDDVLKAENLDNQLLYPLLLLNGLFPAQGDTILPYMDTLIKINDKIIKLESREGNSLGCCTIGNVLQSLSTVTFTNVERNLEDPAYPYIRDWGETMNIKSIKIKMYTPGAKELEMLQKLFTLYFVPPVKEIEKFIETKNSLSREDLQITLRIIFNILEGCDSVLPFWDEPPIIIKPYENCTYSYKPTTGNTGEVKMPDGSNVRLYLIKIMTKLQEIMLENGEDDTKSFLMLLFIWQYLLLGKLRMPVDANFKIATKYYIAKKVVENRMIGSKGWYPTIIVGSVIAQNLLRKLCYTPVLTETHVHILRNVFKLSVSQYSKIRAKSQEILQIALGFFPNAYIILTPNILEVLQKDPTAHHGAYKGILYLLTRKINQLDNLLVKQDWEFIKAVWPTLVLSKPSEKPSVIRLKECIVDSISETFYTTNIKEKVPDSCVSLAAEFWNAGCPPSEAKPTEEEVRAGIEKLEQAGLRNLQAYNDILDILLKSLLERNLHWRGRLMAMNFIYVLAHPEVIYPPQIVRYFLGVLIHESIEERKIALRMFMYIFKQLKRKHPKVTISIPSSSSKSSSLAPGLREDNNWMQYNYDKRPTNALEWDEPRYVHKSNVGYYVWPRELQVYAPSSQQPKFDKSDLTEQDREIEEFFGDQENVDKLISYLSLEGKKGNDKFSNGRLFVFKGLFRNHGDVFIDKFLPHLQKFVQDKQESMQRCAAEIICGMIKGSKHWTYEMTEAMWKSLLPMLRNAFSNLTVETITDWTLCISNAVKDRDPNRLHWLLECLMEESPLGQSEASFVECGRLMILQGALCLQSWRVNELLCRLLKRFQNRLEESPLQNVRDRLAAMLVAIFRTNIKFNCDSNNRSSSPDINDFIDKLYPRLQSLVQEEDPSKPENILETTSSESSAEEVSSSNSVNHKWEKNARFFKIICRWVLEAVMITNLDALSSFYRIYPFMCQLENNDKDEELSKSCSRSLAVLAHSLTMPKHMPAALDAVRNISQSSSWSARASCLEFLQVLIFNNMSMLLSNESWVQAIQEIVLRLLVDERVEVREKAAQLLGGLLHCTILPNQEALLEEFKNKAKSNRRKRSKLNESGQQQVSDAKSINAARLRHAGVLGMCAFVQAHPYDVPKHVPPIFECLSYHLNDPEPIPSTIRKTLNDFKRTHCDGWTGLQGLAENFTEEQFAVLQDLTVPPSYYA